MNKLPDAETALRSILQTLLLVVVTTDDAAKEVRRSRILEAFIKLALCSGVIW